MKKFWSYASFVILGAFILLLSVSSASQKGPDYGQLRVNGQRIEKRIMELAEFGKDSRGGISRVAFAFAFQYSFGDLQPWHLLIYRIDRRKLGHPLVHIDGECCSFYIP